LPTVTINAIIIYAEQATWSQLIAIPPSGIVLTPDQGEVFTYLLRHRQRERIAIVCRPRPQRVFEKSDGVTNHANRLTMIRIMAR
jgi:hypothetical protein